MTIESQALNGALILLTIGTVGSSAIVCHHPETARKLAAWLVGRALYVENVRAEKIRCREIADIARRAEERRHGIQDMEVKTDAI